jgi:hypothetical protein
MKDMLGLKLCCPTTYCLKAALAAFRDVAAGLRRG